MKKIIIILSIALVMVLHINTNARPFRVGQVPNGTKFSCNTCHTNGGGTPRNDFGKLVEFKFLTEHSSVGNVIWGPLLASLDADNDGVTNGQELQDPYGLFSEGQPNPGSIDLVTSAGIQSSSPLTALTVNFNDMTPHVGQTLWLRVFDNTDGKEVARTSQTVTTSFSISLDAILPGHSYNVDFFADLNGNGKYDTPPSDHAWRITIDEAAGNDIVDFAHNTNFVDIKWPYLLTLNFNDMTPHIGQLLEVRVEDDLTSEEIGRRRVEMIPGASFTVEIPGIEMGKEYKVEMYADLNKNGIYDAPPTDHAWKVQFENSTGDYTFNFGHSTTFNDVGWKYLYTVNFLDMNPHVGQLLEMRVVRNDNGVEVNRTSVMIPGPEFVLSIPQIEMDHDYNVEFYADLNGNGQYDAPPTDHAWRVSFNSSTGNFVQNFTHNTNFVDINWSGVTGVNDFAEIPTNFELRQNYPNPFNPATTISFNLVQASNVSLKVYDVLGQEKATLLNKSMTAGLHEVNFNASNLESGTYFYRIETNNNVEVRKMVLLK